MSTKKKSNKTKNAAIGRYGWVVLFMSVVFVLIIVWIFRTKYIEGPQWRELGRQAIMTSDREVRPNRGNIYADDGRLLATSEPLYGIYVDFMSEGIKKDTLMKYVEPLSKELAKRYPQRSAAQYKKIFMDGWAQSRKDIAEIEKIKKAGSDKKYRPKSRYIRIIPRDINYLELKELRRLPYFSQRTNRSGMIAEEKTMRSKPYGALAGRTVGDIYKDYKMGARSGIELKYDSLLRGEPGVKTRQRVSGRWIDVIQQEPVDGLDIKTTLNVDVQDLAEQALKKKLIELKAESGTAIVMETETGEIKALVNLDRLSEGVYAEGNPNAFSYMSEPGSTFKTISLMIALEDGVVTPEEEIYVGKGLFDYNKRTIRDHDWRKGVEKGNITVAKGMYTSSNVLVAKMILKGYESNPKKYVQRIHDLGLAKKLTWDVPLQGREGTSYIRFPDDKDNPFSKVTLPWMSFGYETQLPPIYVLMFYNGIANNGKMIKPYLTKAIMKNGSVEEEFEAEVINPSLCSEKTLKQVQDILRGVVTDGTAKAVNSKYFDISGKTGTAMIASKGGYDGGYYVSFCGYYPSEKPKYTCFVGIRRPQGSPSGGLMPGAVFKEIAEGMYVRNIGENPIASPAPADTIHPFLPKVKKGMYANTRIVLDELDQKYASAAKSAEWIEAKSLEDKLQLEAVAYEENVMPDVKGMGARDALYLLENMNLKVKLAGAGKVAEQSIAPGTKIARGSLVTIQLK
ncbi:penicillin-binding protein [Dysgonomonas sp. 25]|uniref:penicillin-binding protein n=1 Tax=Dysgonomonas sp. 25 TaxID=2302933 RepID=UPI0013D62A48|nr:penicillin-binding protein [Dysgonomonas sp. 25]NDV68701.1 PASTA domain-containing protein [Dysgonomonas sp. 25]